MSAVRVDTNGAASGFAPDQSQEQDVRIPVEVDETAEDQTAGAADAATDDAAGAEAAEPEGMTEEEMVEAAIKAGEQAADDDFKVQLEIAKKELSEVRAQLEEALGSQSAADTKAKEAADRTARLQADWENYRRRIAQERIAERERATEKLVEGLLPVIDDMERAIAHAHAGEMSDDLRSFVDGVDAVHSKLVGVLQKEGVEVIDPAGEPFNPLEHQAVGRVEDPNQYDDTVNDVYQKGYRMGDHVVRSAMVTVTYGGAKRPVPSDDASDEQGAAPADDAE